MIRLDNVTKMYPILGGANVVLNAVTADIPSTENYGILGRNGAGKSTLLRILAGAEQPDSGDVIRTCRISFPIGFASGLSGALTGEENCRFVARLYGADPDEVSAFAFDFSELKNYFYMPSATYSSGMKARLAFAVSMAIDFEVYLVDEVTAVGDASFRKKCKEAFDERRARSSLVMVSHSLGTIRTYCKKCAVLDGGTLHHFDSVDDAAKIYEL